VSLEAEAFLLLPQEHDPLFSMSSFVGVLVEVLSVLDRPRFFFWVTLGLSPLLDAASARALFPLSPVTTVHDREEK